MIINLKLKKIMFFVELKAAMCVNSITQRKEVVKIENYDKREVAET